MPLDQQPAHEVVTRALFRRQPARREREGEGERERGHSFEVLLEMQLLCFLVFGWKIDD